MALQAMLASPRSCSARADAVDASPGRTTASPSTTWPRACRSSCGAPAPDAELLTWPRAGSCAAGRARQAGHAHAGRRARLRRWPRFASQWLRLQDLDEAHSRRAALSAVRPDAGPGDGSVKPSCCSTASCARTAAVLELLTADYTFVNERLAKHYGCRTSRVTEFRRVAVPGSKPSRPARPGQHPHPHLGGRPHLAGAARQVGDGSAARLAAAGTAAQRAVARRVGQGRAAAARCCRCASAWKSTARTRPATRATA
jgi:hypothetical protein